MTTAPQPSLFQPVRFFPAEREVFRKKEKLTPSQRAEKYRVVTLGAHVGPWRNDITPYLAHIMDIWALPYVREVVICKSPQTGGTEAMYNCMSYAMDRDPSTDMVIMPGQDVARKIAEDRIIPMLRQDLRLRDLISENPDDTAKQRVRLRNGEILYMAWSNSSSALASFPIKRLYFDETDKYPPMVGKEADPISLGEKRARTFRYTHKMFKVSTPTRETGSIWKALQRCDVVYHFYARCPSCGCEQVFKFDQLKYPDARTPEDIRREHLARYDCEGCGLAWTDHQKDLAVRAGRWEAVKGENVVRPRRVGYHLPSWLSPDVSLSEVAAAYLTAKKDPAKLVDFYNDYLAEPFIEKHSERKADAVLALKDDRLRGLVPKETAALVLLADTQQRGFYYEVVAFGWGLSLESWQVREGFVETFEGLKEVLNSSDYRDIDGREYRIMAGAIDSGGGTGTTPKHTRTSEVYRFCLENPIMRPIKGRQVMTHPVSSTRLDFFPGTKTPIPGGLVLFLVNVTYFKDQLSTKLAINPADPGAWHLHSECTEEYARQMTVEYRDDRGKWQCPPGKANHYWDTGVYRLALAEIIQVKFWKKPEENQLRRLPRRVVSRGIQ